MTESQLDQIMDFCKPYYTKTGRWHAWDHVTAVQKHACAIAKAEFPEVDTKILIAAATIHDMGRIIKDEGHAEQSGVIAKPFLETLGITKQEISTILDAVTHHDVKKIKQAQTLEARIVYDADKIEILSTYGFMRVAFWLVEEREMELGKAVNFLWEYCENFHATLYSTYAKQFIKEDMKLLSKMVDRFNEYETAIRL